MKQTSNKTQREVIGKPSAFRRWLSNWRFDVVKKPFLTVLSLTLMHSVCFMLAMPKLSWWVFSVIAIAPLIVGAGLWAERGLRLRWLFVAVFVGCLPREFYQHWWIGSVSLFGMPILVSVMSMWTALFAVVFAFAKRRLPRVPTMLLGGVFWLGVEHFRARLFMGGYAWGFVVHPLIDWPAAAAWASVGGVWLVSLFVAVANAGIAQTLLQLFSKADILKTRAIAINVFGAVIALGILAAGAAIIPKPPHGKSISVAVVQTNVPQSNKIAWSLADEVRDFAAFRRMTQEVAVEGSPSLIVWPETMMPGVSIQPDVVKALADAQVSFGSPTPLAGTNGATRIAADEFSKALLELSKTIKTPMLIGEEGFNGFAVKEHSDGSIDFDRKASFNSVYLVNDGSVDSNRYDKIELTPFGEYMPVISRFDWLEDALLSVAASGMRFNLSAGRDLTVFQVPVIHQSSETNKSDNVRCVTPICFEVTVPELCRNLVYENGERRADILINLTNDGWFTDSDRTRLQHLQIARWRCAELATPMARAANTGMSAWIDARGKIIRDNVQVCDAKGQPTAVTGSAQVGGIATQAIELPTQGSIYGRFGDVVPWLCTPLSSLILIGAFVNGRRASNSTNIETKQKPV
ncbi:MAG: apolipoprotein N-acyltransferase [Phycisphaerales bacterium]